MVVPTGMVLFFAAAGNWKKKKEITMSENKAYKEIHGTKNKNQSRMQQCYSPHPKEALPDVSGIAAPIIDANSALYERLEELDRELVAIRTYLLASKSDQSQIKETSIVESKITSKVVAVVDLRSGFEDAQVSEEEEEGEEEDVPQKLTAMQTAYLFIVYLRSVTLEEIVVIAYEQVRSLLSSELLLKKIMELRPPTASNISDCFYHMKILAVSTTDSIKCLIGIDGRNVKEAFSDDTKKASIGHECNSNSQVKMEIRKDKEAPSEIQILPSPGALTVASESASSSSSDQIKLPNTELKDPSSNKNSKRWWIRLW